MACGDDNPTAYLVSRPLATWPEYQSYLEKRSVKVRRTWAAGPKRGIRLRVRERHVKSQISFEQARELLRQTELLDKALDVQSGFQARELKQLRLTQQLARLGESGESGQRGNKRPRSPSRARVTTKVTSRATDLRQSGCYARSSISWMKSIEGQAKTLQMLKCSPDEVVSYIEAHVKRLNALANEAHRCSIDDCESTIKTPGLLRKHKCYVHGSLSYACDQCDKRFAFGRMRSTTTFGLHRTRWKLPLLVCRMRCILRPGPAPSSGLSSVSALNSSDRCTILRKHSTDEPTVPCPTPSCKSKFYTVTESKRHNTAAHSPGHMKRGVKAPTPSSFGLAESAGRHCPATMPPKRTKRPAKALWTEFDRLNAMNVSPYAAPLIAPLIDTAVPFLHIGGVLKRHGVVFCSFALPPLPTPTGLREQLEEQRRQREQLAELAAAEEGQREAAAERAFERQKKLLKWKIQSCVTPSGNCVINNVLDLTKIELGNVTLSKDAIDVAAVLDEVVKICVVSKLSHGTVVSKDRKLRSRITFDQRSNVVPRLRVPMFSLRKHDSGMNTRRPEEGRCPATAGARVPLTHGISGPDQVTYSQWTKVGDPLKAAVQFTFFL
ncbi:hypothetical protein BDZ88DRAFT_489681 [Geranomyces variabilis]|nr:hypothetical protein BDZ88DRAFT_489681 [Geranomyces variabilis]